MDHNEQLKAVFAAEIPEIANGLVEIKAIARMPGIRNKVAVKGLWPGVDPIEDCVGLGGCRLRRITDRLDGERVELVRWTDEPQQFIVDALQPAVIDRVELHPNEGRATIVVTKDQLFLVDGMRGSQNRELASKLCGWQIDVLTR